MLHLDDVDSLAHRYLCRMTLPLDAVRYVKLVSC
jgi:hypothetical protein